MDEEGAWEGLPIACSARECEVSLARQTVTATSGDIQLKLRLELCSVASCANGASVDFSNWLLLRRIKWAAVTRSIHDQWELAGV